MKNNITKQILIKMKSKNKYKKHLIPLVLVGGAFTFLVLTLSAWYILNNSNVLTTKSSQIFASPLAQSTIADFKNISHESAKLRTLSCWNELQSLFSLQPWIEFPIHTNLSNLKSKCFETKSESCNKLECQNVTKQ